MYGFKPKGQRQAAQHLADGGFVATAKRMMGFKPDDPAQAARLAEYKANAAREKAAAAAPAPAPPAAVTQYTGMSAMQRREKEQGLADGGLVAKMKSADAGAAPFGSRGLNQMRDMPAKMQAMGFGPAKAEAPAPAPVTDPRAAKLQAMIPQIEAMGFKQAQAAADGGMIRGPGDGTSDSIPDEMEPGTFIMPADSTQALGLDDEAAEGEKVPVRVSNGEYQLPPERVQAVGAAVLQAIKGMTHTPTGQAGEGEPMAQGFKPKGEKPQQFFAEGGMVENPAVAGAATGATASPAAPAAAAAPAAPMGWAERNEQRNNQVTASSIVDSPERRAAEAALKTPEAPIGAALGGSTAPAPLAPSDASMGWAERNAKRSTEVTASSMVDSPERRAAQAALNPVRPPAMQPATGMSPATTTAQPALGSTPALAGASKPLIPQPGYGFQPAQRFSKGGEVKSPEELVRLQNQTAMYVQGAQAAAADRPPDAPAAAPAPAAPAPQSDYARQMSAMGSAFADGAAWLGKTVVSAPGYGFNKGDATTPTTTATAQQPAAAVPTPSAAPAPMTSAAAVAPPVAPTAQPQAPTGTATAAPSGGTEIAPGAYKNAPGQYSDNAAGFPAAAVGAGNPNAQNMAAANNLARQSATAPAPVAAGFPGVTAPTVRNSTNDWATRNNLRNLEVSASSITNNGGRFDRSGPGDSAAMAAYKAALATDQTMQQAQPGADVTAMRENAGLQREGVQQTGANTRAGMQEAGANSRDAARMNLAGQELGMKREAQGFQTRAQAQQEQLRGVLTDPNTTPQQRAQAQQALQALTGKGDSWKAVALQGGTDAQGNKTESLLGAVNERTGEMKRMEGGALPQLDKNAQAISIRDDKTLTREQKVEALRKMGYQG
ncbi:hypothetical protein [Acidovorax sp. RAC01]|uniref:hypothetical protein n=1 Tax=Acidovorax sp. RAC01 TaxID=1842533 RepID=UPI00083E7FEC|nr:hypothetical protein [Acidovorax sp. RAC01]AOG21624.1 hypothetical protein BSY15_3808 [Acidovorax sp. RAC01]AOG22608.1 hypothetical protein BSY15_3730 [Acidovorax sp. RAC01]